MRSVVVVKKHIYRREIGVRRAQRTTTQMNVTIEQSHCPRRRVRGAHHCCDTIAMKVQTTAMNVA
jgi:hypothetical protein